MQTLAFSLEPLPPFRLDFTAWALLRRPINAIDSWDGEAYSRVLAINDRAVFIRIVQSRGLRSPRLQIKAIADRLPLNAEPQIVGALEKLLGLRVNMKSFYRFAKTDPRLSDLSERFMGLKPPRFPSVFEGIVNGIACQQLSLHVGLTLLNRLAAEAGLPFDTATETRFGFPTAENLAKLPMRALRLLGFSTNKGLALKRLSATTLSGKFDPEGLTNLGNEQAVERLLELRGVGRWTAEYVLLRGLGRTNLFPGDDVGARNNLRRWLKLDGALNYESVNKALERWRPYSGLLYFHLLLDGLTNSPHLSNEGGFEPNTWEPRRER
jgi:DNA-3-methyladenine glycosylase II